MSKLLPTFSVKKHFEILQLSFSAFNVIKLSGCANKTNKKQ